jgi:hypothetical protein
VTHRSETLGVAVDQGLIIARGAAGKVDWCTRAGTQCHGTAKEANDEKERELLKLMMLFHEERPLRRSRAVDWHPYAESAWRKCRKVRCRFSKKWHRCSAATRKAILPSNSGPLVGGNNLSNLAVGYKTRAAALAVGFLGKALACPAPAATRVRRERQLTRKDAEVLFPSPYC